MVRNYSLQAREQLNWRVVSVKFCKSLDHPDHAVKDVIPPEPPVVACFRPDRSAARKGAPGLRGLRTLAREHRSGIFSATTGGLAGSHLILLVSSELVFAFSCCLPHQLLFMFFQILHI